MRSGDSGFIMKEELFIVGRIKDLIIVHGRNYYPQDFEFIVEKIEGIRPGCSAVFTIEMTDDGYEAERLCVTAEVREAVAKTVHKGGPIEGLISVFRGKSDGFIKRCIIMFISC